jgi:hypothetical protein
VALDSGGGIYAVGDTGSDPSAGFPTTVGPSLTYRGGTDAWVAKVGGGATATPTTTATVTVTPTPTLTPTPGPIPVCSPRPSVVTNAVANGDGRLRVTLSTTSNPGPANLLLAITWTSLTNAAVNLIGVGDVTQGQRTVLPPGSLSAQLLISRVTSGQATTVRMVVTDGCGDWSTFAGGGSNAF